MEYARFRFRSLAVLLPLAFSIGCEKKPGLVDAAGPGEAGAAFMMGTEPPDARSVKDLRDHAEDDEQVTLVGRIGGDDSPWVDGIAAFLVVDESLKPCNERDDDACPTPWDYCCDTDRLPQFKAMVKVVGADGRVVATGARELLGVKEMQTIVVTGRAQRGDGDNLTILADKVFVRGESL